MLKRLEVDKELCKDFIRSHGQKETVLQIERASGEDVCKARLERGEKRRREKPHKAQTASFLHCPGYAQRSTLDGLITGKKQWDKSLPLLGVCPGALIFPHGARWALPSGRDRPGHSPRAAPLRAASPAALLLTDIPLNVCYQQAEDFIRLLLQKMLSGN